MTLHLPMNRRRFLGKTAAAAATSWLSARALAGAAETKNALPTTASDQRYKIAVCDWMILKRQRLGAFQLTKDIGADGVEVDMGSLGQAETFANELAKPEVRQQFLDKAKELNLEISSIAMSGFYAQSFGNRPTVPSGRRD